VTVDGVRRNARGDGTRAGVVAPLLFAGDGREPRRRRVADVVMLAVGATIVLGAALASGRPAADQEDLVAAVRRLLGWLDPVWTVSYAAASAIWIGLLVVAVIAGRRLLARDMAVAAVGVLAGAWVLAEAVDGRAPGLADLLWRAGDPSYPAARVALLAAVGLVAGPELARPAHRTIGVAVGLTAVGSVVIEAAYVAHVLGGLGLGLVAGALVRVVFGSSAGFPDGARVGAALHDLGVDARDLRPAARPGVVAARFTATATPAAETADGADGGAGARGRDRAVFVYGRDARDAQVFARLWRLLWYRDPGSQASLTRRGLVEHEALMLLVAERAGAPVPGLVAAGMAHTGDAVLVTDEPAGVPLAELPRAAVSDALLARLWGAAARLRAAGLGHGRLNGAAVVAVGDRVLVTDWSAGRMAAPDDVLATDVAELLVSTALVAGGDRALTAARAAMGDEAMRAAVPYVQHAALTPWLRDALRDGDLDVDDLRGQVAAATGAEAGEVAELRRVSLRDLLLLGLTLVAAYALLSQIADIGIDTIIDEVADADLGWLLVGLVLAQVPLVCDAAAMIAAVGRPLPLGPTTVLESAIKFINLSVPSVAGKLVLTIRYLQRQGVPRVLALTQGALDSAAGLVVQVLVLLVVLPVVDVEVTPGGGDGDGSGLIWVGIAIVAVAVVGVLVVALVPALRAKVAPTVRAAWDSARALLSSPQRLVRLLLANVGSQLAYALVLGAAVRSLSSDAAAAVSLADLLFVNTAVTLFAGMMPVPGGIGVAEAGLTAGLVAVGVPESTALAAALLHRLLTYYLPPIWGFVSLRWLGRHGFV
jgi:glycosyltransferase 2 family protein